MNEREVAGAHARVENDNRLWLPVRAVAEALGASITRLTRDRISLEVVLDVGERAAEHRTATLTFRQFEDDTAYVAARNLADALHLSLNWDDHQRIVTLQTTTQDAEPPPTALQS